MEIIDEFFGKMREFITANPKYVISFVAVIFFITAIGNFLNWKWVTNPKTNKYGFFYDLLGPKVYRFLIGTFHLVCAIAICVILYLYF